MWYASKCFKTEILLWSRRFSLQAIANGMNFSLYMQKARGNTCLDELAGLGAHGGAHLSFCFPTLHWVRWSVLYSGMIFIRHKCKKKIISALIMFSSTWHKPRPSLGRGDISWGTASIRLACGQGGGAASTRVIATITLTRTPFLPKLPLISVLSQQQKSN